MLLAADYEFINEEIDINIIPPKKCIFTTKSDRNLHILINAWEKIFLSNKNAKLYVNPPFNLNQNQ